MAGLEEIFEQLISKNGFALIVTAYTAICIILYVKITLKKTATQECRRKILLVTAHPDDECMFFSPTIQAEINKGNFVYLICLSKGDYYGVGETRRYELINSCRLLGVPVENVKIVDNIKLQDSPNIEWDQELLEKEILLHIYGLQPNEVITFDSYGVSGHRNHRALYQCVKDVCLKNKMPKNTLVYVLRSHSMLRKYLSVLDLPVTCLTSKKMFVSSPMSALKAWKAMFAHRSQLMWFRFLYIFFSNYMFVNDLQQVCHHGDC